MRSRRSAVLTMAMLALVGGVAQGADHRDGPGAQTDATVDITDVYAWMSADGMKVYLVMDLQGANTGATAATKFSNAALYAFHINSGSTFQDPNAQASTIICRFDAAATQGFQCWGPSGEYVTGAVGTAAGSVSSTGKIKAAALVRDDPFWFNIRGFLGLAGTVKGAAGGLTFDKAGCPAINAPTSAALVGLLKSGPGAEAAADDFGKTGKAPVACVPGKCDATAVTNGNVLSIVLSVDKTLLTTGGPILGVWGSTNMAQ